MTVDWKKHLTDWKVWLVVASMALGVSKAIRSHDHCERLGQVHEWYTDSTYSTTTVDLCIRR